jgi:mannose-6-phosphate isomerase-like protein (cupin superfamily)
MTMARVRVTATWFQGPAQQFIEVCREGFSRGVNMMHSLETTSYRFPTHTNNLVMDRSESEASEVFVGKVEPGHVPPLHVHHETEQVFYILSGQGANSNGCD